MEDMTKVVLDAMGGDNAPGEIVKGAVDALARETGLHIILVGRREDIPMIKAVWKLFMQRK